MAKTNTFKKLSTPQKLFRSLDNVRALNILGEAGIKALPVSELTKVGLRGVFHCVGLCYQSVTKLKYEYSSKENGDIDDILSLQQGLGGGGHLGLLVMNTLDGTKSLSPQTKTFRFLDNTIRTIGFGIPNLVEVWRFCPNFNYDKKNNITLESSLNVMASLSNLAMLMSPLYTQAARPYLPHIAAITLGLSTAAKWIKDGSEENTDDAQEEVKKHIGISPQGKIDREKQRTTWSNIDPKWYDID